MRTKNDYRHYPGSEIALSRPHHANLYLLFVLVVIANVVGAADGAGVDAGGCAIDLSLTAHVDTPLHPAGLDVGLLRHCLQLLGEGRLTGGDVSQHLAQHGLEELWIL